jgi:hypothetical protein
MYKISVTLNNGVKILEKGENYVDSYEILAKLKEKYKGKIVESSMIGSDNENDRS